MLKKVVSGLKQKKVITTIEFYTFELVLVKNFSLTWQFGYFRPKRLFQVGNGKIALVRASMAVPYYIKLFHTEDDRYNGILMSLLLLVTETIIILKDLKYTLSDDVIPQKF